MTTPEWTPEILKAMAELIVDNTNVLEVNGVLHYVGVDFGYPTGSASTYSTSSAWNQHYSWEPRSEPDLPAAKQVIDCVARDVVPDLKQLEAPDE